jgi:hypothetical protein
VVVGDDEGSLVPTVGHRGRRVGHRFDKRHQMAFNRFSVGS